MKAREFKKMIKEVDPQQLLNDYMSDKYFFTDKQLDKIFEVRKIKGSILPKGTCVRYGRTS